MASLPSQGRWSAKDTLRLMECMEENLLSNDSRAFQKSQADLDWEKVAFEPFTGEMCRLKWQEISQKLRKFRTLSELVLEAKEQVTHPHKSGKYKKHPDFPKRPLTAYLRFYKEQRAQYLQMHPELNNKQLTRVLSEKYRQLPEQARQKYVQDFQKEREDFEEKVAQFRKEHPDLAQKFKRRVARTRDQRKVPEKLEDNEKNGSSAPEMGELSPKMKLREPKKPPMNGYHKFHEDSWSSRELCHLPMRERMVEISRRWQRVPPSMKENYKRQAEEMQQQYWVDLDAWLKSLSPEEYAAYGGAQTSCGKRKCTMVTDGPSPKFRIIDPQSSSAKELPELPREKQGLLAVGSDSSEPTERSPRTGEDGMEDGTKDEESSSSESGSGDEDTDESSEDSLSDSSSSKESSFLDSI
uniref:upstream-binding factor 1-like protein 1 n=1 Tax=Jaculus jaculus TaxID=51337 RepID=UPI001E1B33B4|nr:upstream-binding factor 1-like protein 1 [Jaculus jaculus]